MRVRGASRAGGEPPGQDRWAATERAVIVLDGASAFDPSAPRADQYVDGFLDELRATVDSSASLPTILRDAIGRVSARLRLAPGGGPSSTILILREAGEWLEIAVLGDSTAVLGFRDGGTERITDDRISDVAVEQRRTYRGRLRDGLGYDATHRALLTDIQRAERASRNRCGGYWIAEADPAAADNAVVRRYRRAALAWCVLATDGAQRVIDHLHLDWAVLPKATQAGLDAILDDLQAWEAQQDSNASQLPRAKRHDDKTIVTWSSDT
jgi:hypothetical protein